MVSEGRAQGPVWIRDRATGLIIDETFLSHTVWSEVLMFDADDSGEIGRRAWRRCKERVDAATLGSRYMAPMAESIAHLALRTLEGMKVNCRT